MGNRAAIALLVTLALLSTACGSRAPRATRAAFLSPTPWASESTTAAASPVESPTRVPVRRSAKPGPAIHTSFRVPDEVALQLNTPRSGSTRKLVLRLSAFGAPDGCRGVGPLEISSRLATDLHVTVRGYRYSENEASGSVCAAVVKTTTATVDIPLSWARAETRAVTVTLSGRKNAFSLSLDRYVATLDPGTTPNVFSGKRDLPDRRAGSQRVTAILYPPDVGHLYLAGSVDEDRDYRDDMRAFARDHGWLDTADAYGIPDADPERTALLWIVVRNRSLPPPNTGEPVGRLDGADVYLASEE